MKLHIAYDGGMDVGIGSGYSLVAGGFIAPGPDEPLYTAATTVEAQYYESASATWRTTLIPNDDSTEWYPLTETGKGNKWNAFTKNSSPLIIEILGDRTNSATQLSVSKSGYSKTIELSSTWAKQDGQTYIFMAMDYYNEEIFELRSIQSVDECTRDTVPTAPTTTKDPTPSPTPAPTDNPTPSPTGDTQPPSSDPTNIPTAMPSSIPSFMPTEFTMNPTVNTDAPSKTPSVSSVDDPIDTSDPSIPPSMMPSDSPVILVDNSDIGTSTEDVTDDVAEEPVESDSGGMISDVMDGGLLMIGTIGGAALLIVLIGIAVICYCLIKRRKMKNAVTFLGYDDW